MATSADYQKLLNAVANYYGSGTDAWSTIIKNLGTNDAGEVAKLLRSVPGVDVYTSENGAVLDYVVRQSMDSFASSENIGSVINSNNISSTINGSLTANIPSIVSKSTTGHLEGISGIGLKADTGLSVTGVLSTVGVAIGIVGVGAKLGKIIGDSLYTSNPDIWDDNVISGLSQVDWGKFGVALKDDVTGRLKRGILGLFGVDGDDTTMYLDENAVGYLTWYLQNIEMLDQGTGTLDGSDIDGTRILQGSNIHTCDNVQLSGDISNASIFGKYLLEPNIVDSAIQSSTNSIVRDIQYVNNSGNYSELVATDKSLGNGKCGPINNNKLSAYSSGGVKSFTHNGKQVEYKTIDKSGLNWIFTTPVTSEVYDYTFPLDMTAWGLIYGDVVYKSKYDGVSNNKDSTQFNPTGVGSVSSALGALKNQYPELWENSIKKTVPQEDGKEEEHTYLPIPIPNFKNAFDTKPTTGTPNQKNPQVDPSTTPEEEQKNLADTIAPPQPPSNNPNTGGGNSPNIILPTQQASSLWAIYNPSLEQLNQLGAWLWSTNFIDQILKIFNDPMQAIIGLHKVYVNPNISGSGNIKVGYLDSGVPSNIVGNQYTYIECGSVSLREYYGNVLDYSPYTTVQLYLPFIGIVSLDIADVSRSTISIRYGVDVLTGACLASVSVQRDNAGGVIYQYSGNCACQYPLSSGSYMGMVTGAIGALGSLARGSIFGTAMGIAGMHTNIEHSGGFSGNAGAMGIKRPYLIISRPQSAMNDGFPSIQGYPSNYFTRLGNCSGFTQVAECHVENISATDKELDKIKDLLKEGVIL